MKRFSINLSGRIRNFSLPKNQPLLPLMEAVVNSIHAIEERKDKGLMPASENGYIDIFVKRADMIDGVPKQLAPITGFVIEDNGIGFDDNNLNSFLESDSAYKKEKGGKGVGRFSWLKAFGKVEISSTFILNGKQSSM